MNIYINKGFMVFAQLKSCTGFITLYF